MIFVDAFPFKSNSPLQLLYSCVMSGLWLSPTYPIQHRLKIFNQILFKFDSSKS